MINKNSYCAANMTLLSYDLRKVCEQDKRKLKLGTGYKCEAQQVF